MLSHATEKHAFPGAIAPEKHAFVDEAAGDPAGRYPNLEGSPMEGEKRIYWRSPVPETCQLSGRKITDKFVDGRVPGTTTWGEMHPAYFRQLGGAFGQGNGQLYEKQADGRWLKVEG